MDPIGNKPYGFHGLSMGYESSFFNNIISCFIFYFGSRLNNIRICFKKCYVLKMCHPLNCIIICFNLQHIFYCENAQFLMKSDVISILNVISMYICMIL